MAAAICPTLPPAVWGPPSHAFCMAALASCILGGVLFHSFVAWATHEGASPEAHFVPHVPLGVQAVVAASMVAISSFMAFCLSAVAAGALFAHSHSLFAG